MALGFRVEGARGGGEILMGYVLQGPFGNALGHSSDPYAMLGTVCMPLYLYRFRVKGLGV